MNIIQSLHPADILHAIDRSVDWFICDCYPEDCDCEESGEWKRWIMQNKLDDCDNYFRNDIQENGVQNPICIEIVGREWVMGNGHHRLALALSLGITELLVLFAEDGDYMHEEVTDPDEC